MGRLDGCSLGTASPKDRRDLTAPQPQQIGQYRLLEYYPIPGTNRAAIAPAA